MLALDLKALKSAGIRALLLDIDNTLLPRDTSVFPPEFVDWLGGLPEEGLSAYLVSNNWHDHIFDRAAEVGLPVVAKALKPLPFGFLRAARALGLRMRQCAVVGDQVFTDVLGGNLAGATTVLVEPLSTSDLPHTLVLRRLERVIMAGRRPVSREARAGED